MLQKKDVYYYRCLAYAKGGLGLGMLLFMLVGGVSAKLNMPYIHMYMPYWIALPLLMQAAAFYATVYFGSRKPLGIWLPFFFITLFGIGAFAIMLPAQKVDFYRKYPCVTQLNTITGDSRCVCSLSSTDYLMIDGATTATPCFRALNILNVTSNINLMLSIVALIPELLGFVLVCNDLCCIKSRRSALVPQILQIAPGGTVQPAMVPASTETVTYRTDDQQPTGSAGPLPQKQEVPHSF